MIGLRMVVLETGEDATDPFHSISISPNQTAHTNRSKGYRVNLRNPHSSRTSLPNSPPPPTAGGEGEEARKLRASFGDEDDEDDGMRAGGAGEVSGLGDRGSGSGNWSRRRSGRGCRNCGRRRGRGAKTGFGDDAVVVEEDEVVEVEVEVEEKGGGGGVDGGVARSESVSSGSGGGGVVAVVVAGVREIEGGVDIVCGGGGGGGGGRERERWGCCSKAQDKVSLLREKNDGEENLPLLTRDEPS
ncbi:unnamed protein product [Tuber aestivum]|uniref:Uncharacterized protein n=1 Tax=Tuber aestivum TaxID=59557 RepID=A0A292Q4Y2_9PEZI|nr:unnamed protein product [Tuber aestivum]